MTKRPIRLLAFLLLAVTIALAMPGEQAGAQVNSTIRVLLKRLKVEDTLQIDVQGTYMLKDGTMTFRDGASIVVVLRGDQLVLHTDTLSCVMGHTMTLVRCEDERSSALLLGGGSGLYEGDLVLSAADGVIRPVLHIDIEDYLLGVLPYEMGDSFPLEALKAQAIAARTYALRKSGSAGDYDVEDTTNDQAYKGRSSSSPLSEQAVRETEGLCGMYRGKLAWCYYSASNGGQTELGQHVWPTEDPDAYAYMDMRDDPYDYENDASVVKRYTLAKKPGDKGVGTALHSALVAALAPQLTALGYASDDDLIRFDEIVQLEATQPRFDEPSRLKTQLEFTLKLSVRSCTFRDTGVPGSPSEPAPDASPSPTPAPTATPAYSPYTRLKDTFVVSLPIFPEAEQAMGLSINVYPNELISVLDIGSAYLIESRRFGHGVGMSQRGAQQMAQKHGKTYLEILAFYYPGMELGRLQADRQPLPTVNLEMMATPAPTPSPTPRPTLMPVSRDNLPHGAYVATVSNISEDSTLNLRASPSLSSEVVRRLYKDQTLIVLKATKDGWAHVKTDVVEGYVRSEYLQTASK